MIIVEITAVDGRHLLRYQHLGIYDDHHIPGLHSLVKAIHMNGALACIQLHHPGSWGTDPISPSGVPCVEFGIKWVSPRAMTLEEIVEIPRLFGASAERAKHVGFDAVELHGGTGYLLHQFTSPHTNLRIDKYGGSLENRWQLSLEVIDEIKRRCGSEFPIGYALVADELLPDGLHFQSDVKPFVRRLKEVGVSYVRVQLGTYDTVVAGEGVFAMRSPSPSKALEMQAELKKEIGIPVVITSLNSGDPDIMEEVLQKDYGDALALGRPLLTDPDLPKKIFQGRSDDIRMCSRCGHCYDTGRYGWQIACQQNIEVGGKEVEYAIHAASSSKKVLVIGGGPSGLEVARVAALRGHKIILMEKGPKLGGSVLLAILPIGKEILKGTVIDWLESQCRKLGVNIQLNNEATAKVAEEFEPNVVVVATGAVHNKSSIPGVERKNVLSAEDALTGNSSIRGSVVVLGGGQVGVETADFIAEKGKVEKVTIVEMLPTVAKDMDVINRAYLMQKLSQYNVRILTNTLAERITDKGVEVCDKEWRRMTLEADTVILALGYVSNNVLVKELKDKVPELYAIGSCVKPGKIMNAIHEGSYIGRII